MVLIQDNLIFSSTLLHPLDLMWRVKEKNRQEKPGIWADMEGNCSIHTHLLSSQLPQITSTAGFKHVLIHRLGNSLRTLILLCLTASFFLAVEQRKVCVGTGQVDSRRSLQDYTRATLSRC